MGTSSNSIFNAKDTLRKIKEEISVRKKRTCWSRSKLQKYLAELVQLRLAGASYSELQYWLKAKRMNVARTTIRNFLLCHGVEKTNGDKHGAL